MTTSAVYACTATPNDGAAVAFIAGEIIFFVHVYGGSSMLRLYR